MGVETREEALAHFGVPGKVQLTVDEMVQALDSDDDDAFAHFGTLGMKWGVRKKIGAVAKSVGDARAAKKVRAAQLSTPNPGYSTSQRTRDKNLLGAGATGRINRGMNQGKSHKDAVGKEQRRRKIQASMLVGAAVTIQLMRVLGPELMADVKIKAATNRDKRAQATEEAIRNGPKKPDTKNSKKNFRGVYNVTTM